MMVLLNEVATDGLEVSMKPPSVESGATEMVDQGTVFNFEIQLKSKRLPLPPATRAVMTGHRDSQEGATTSTNDVRGKNTQVYIAQREAGAKTVTDPWALAREWSGKELDAMVKSCINKDTGRLYRVVYAIVLCSESSGMLAQDIKVTSQSKALDQSIGHGLGQSTN
jgi:hypothetical protein